MSGFRHEKAGLVDRSQPVSFCFDGQRLNGFGGDTVASALMASGRMLVGRSFKYHRPRGVMSAGVEEGGALFNLHDGARRIANVKGTMAELSEGLHVYSQNAFPSLKFDLGAVNSLIAPFITAGFYYKTFMGPARSTALWMFWEKFIRRAAGLGTASRSDDPDCYDIANQFCDVLVVGGGPAGLHAAAALAEAGKSVILVEQDFAAGGAMLDTGSQRDVTDVAALLRRLKKAGARVMLRTTAFGLYDGLVVGAVERVADHLAVAPPFCPREIFHIIHPKQIILASGASERGIAFGNNDRPGVMLTHAVARYASRFGVMAGQTAVLAGCHDGSYDDALMLAGLGMQITLLDARVKKSCKASAAEAAGIVLYNGKVPVNAVGNHALAAVEIADIDSHGNVGGMTSIIGCDVLGMSGGYSPVIHLPSHRGEKPVWDSQLAAFRAGPVADGVSVIGAADGYYDHQAVLVSAQICVARLLGKKPVTARQKRGLPGPVCPLFEVRMKGRRTKAFLDPQHDVTGDDIRQAKQEGFVSVEHMKRYTTLGMATDQGRMGNILGLAVMAEARNTDVAQAGMTTFRPPFTPVSIGALAGRYRGPDWRAVRRTPLHHLHEQRGAVMTDAGLWKRAWYYPKPGETIDDAYIREAALVRQTVGMVDVSTLGKIAVQGPDATEFLNRLYVNSFARLAIGKARYGVMLRDDGMVFDDGTTWRLAEDDYFMTTTTAQAGPVMQFLEELLQRRWTDLHVHVSSVTDQWAGMAVAGPGARAVLADYMPEIDWDDRAFPFMAVRQVTISRHGRDFVCRIARISFSGEQAFELYVPADRAGHVWTELGGYAERAGGCLYGTEALGTLRIEKGHVTAAELDGRVTLEDAGLGRMASSSKPFVGSVLRQRPLLQGPARPQLVGIFPKDLSARFSAGGVLCAPEAVSGFGEGWVTAVTHSPAFGHWIGLGFISGGASAWQDRDVIIADPVRGQHITAQIVSPHMFDPSGERQHG